MKISENIFSLLAKNSRLFALIFLGSLVLQFFLPWWMCALVSFLAAFWLAKSASQAFWIGAFALFLLWALVASFWHFSSLGILSNKVADMFHLPNGIALIAVAAVLAGLVGGNSALSGYLIKGLFNK